MYPDLSLILCEDWQFQLFSFPEARISPLSGEKDITRWVYVPKQRRADGPGDLGRDVKFGAFRVTWKGEDYIVYLVRVIRFVERAYVTQR